MSTESTTPPIEVISAEVFDPAASGHYDLPVRLEIRVSEIPEEPTHTAVGDTFTRTNYKWLSRLFSDHIAWDEDDTNLCAAIYNSHDENHYEAPLFPVTAMFAGEQYGMDFFVTVDRVARILRRLDNGYELLPNPLFSVDKMHGWMIQHSSRICVDCVNEAAEVTPLTRGTIDLAGLARGNYLYRLGPYRPAPLCVRHYHLRRQAGSPPAFVV